MGETIYKFNTSQESAAAVVHDGWLIKSPPTKLWKARWRQRWFVLRNSGGPGHYFLEYYVDEHCKKLKGKIDLDLCEQVDAGLSFEKGKEKYQYMFNVTTPKRTYYLVAKNDNDMNKWVNVICQVCGLKPYSQDEDPQYEIFSYAPHNSPDDLISGPYIPISECISGSHLKDTNFNNRPPKVNWDTFPSLGDLKPVCRPNKNHIANLHCRRSYGKIPDSESTPPRPPKPLVGPGHNYLNLDGATEGSKPTTPVTPKFSEISIESSSEKNNSATSEGQVFKYDFFNSYQEESSFSSANSNPSSPTVVPPPVVHRDLKPKSKARANNFGPVDPPSINRRLKPLLKKFAVEDDFRENVQTKKKIIQENLNYCQRTRLSSTSEDEDFAHNEKDLFFEDFNDDLSPNYSRRLTLLQYLDLDLHASGKTLLPSAAQTQAPPSSGTEYKTVDFLKTDAFNRTRQRVEEERKQCSDNP